MGNGSSGNFGCHDSFYHDRADVPLYGILIDASGINPHSREESSFSLFLQGDPVGVSNGSKKFK